MNQNILSSDLGSAFNILRDQGSDGHLATQGSPSLLFTPWNGTLSHQIDIQIRILRQKLSPKNAFRKVHRAYLIFFG